MEYRELIQSSLNYIEDNLENEIDMEKAAKAAYISLSSFYKLFFAHVGYSANEYANFAESAWRHRISLAATCASWMLP